MTRHTTSTTPIRGQLPWTTSRAGRTRSAMMVSVLAGVLGATGTASAQFSGGVLNQQPEAIKRLDVDEKLGATLPMDLEFTNSDGKRVKLGDYFPVGDDGKRHGKPTVLVLGYYRCPVVCSVVIAKLTEAYNEISYTVGQDYNALVFSINPDETTAEAHAYKVNSIETYNRGKEAGVAEGWHFHTSPESTSKALADAMGWQYTKLPNGEFGHPIGYMLVTPDGRIARYMYGYAGKDQATQVKLAILEASEGKISKTIADRVVGFCYMYDAAAGGYAVKAFRVMQLGGGVTLLGLGGLVIGLRVSEVLKRRRRAATLESDLLSSNDRPMGGARGPAIAGR